MKKVGANAANHTDHASHNAYTRPLQIETQAVLVLIFTQRFRIKGTLHIPHRGRVTDFLNKTLGSKSKDIFLPVTDAECYSLEDGKLKYSTKFLTVHKDHIHLLIPA